MPGRSPAGVDRRRRCRGRGAEPARRTNASNPAGRDGRTVESPLYLRHLRRRIVQPIRPSGLSGRRGTSVARIQPPVHLWRRWPRQDAPAPRDCHRTGRQFPGAVAVYLSSEQFTNELIDAIRYDHTAAFRARYRTIDLLLIDDIQFIAGKERTQEEFFHTFNDLYESRKQIVLSSDSPPKSIPDIEERLRSRFEWGLIADVQPPDFETRVAILKKKAALERTLLPDEVAYLMAGRVKSNIRQLEGSLTRMIAIGAMTGRETTVDLAQEALSDLWGDEKAGISIELIQRKVSECFGLKLSELKAKDRTKAVAFPRQIAMYLARQLTHTSLAEVGRAFGGKHHTTVLHAVGKIQTLLREDPALRKTIHGLTQSLTL